MKATIEYNSRKIEVNISNPIDISIPIDIKKKNINAWYVEDPKIFPENIDGEIVKVSEGAVVNFNNILEGSVSQGYISILYVKIVENLLSLCL